MKVADLSADLSVNTSRFTTGLSGATRSMRTAQQQWTSSLGAATRSFSDFSGNVSSSLSVIGDLKAELGGIGGLIASALSGQKVISYSDNWKALAGRLTNATGSMAQLVDVQSRLFDVSQRTGTPLAANVDAYTRLSRAVTSTQKDQYDLVHVTEILSKALALNGTSASGAADFYLQLGQAASSNFQAVGQELQTFADQAPLVYQALQKAIAGSGMSLRDFAKNGKLNNDIFLKAVLDMGDQVDKQFSNVGNTVERAMTRLDNAFLKFIGENSNIQNGTGSLASAINSLANNFDILATAVTALAGGQLAKMATQFIASRAVAFQLATAAAAQAAALNEATVAAAANTRASLAMAAAQKAAAGSVAAETIVVGSSGVAAVAAAGAFTTFTGAVTVLGRGLLALAGGPVGLIATAIFAALALHTNQATQAQQQYNDEVGSFVQRASEFNSASASTRQQIQQDVNAKIASYQKELAALNVLVSGYQSMASGSMTSISGILGRFKLGADEALGKMGIGDAPSEIIGKTKALQAAITGLQQLQDSGNGAGGVPGLGANGQKQKVDDLVTSLKQETQELQAQVATFGMQNGALFKAKQQIQLTNSLKKDGLQLDQQTLAQVNASIDAGAKAADQLEALQKAKKADDMIGDLKASNDELEQENDLFGKSEGAIYKATESLKIYNELRKDGITLSTQQQASLDAELDRADKEHSLNEELKKQQDDLKEKERDRKEAANQLGAAFQSAFEDAVVSGKKFGDVLNALLQDIEKVILRFAITKPIINGIAATGIGDWVSDALPSFAVGSARIPYDMTANIHKDEMILPAAMANQIRSGAGLGGGSAPVNVSIVNNAGAQVSTQAQTNANGGTDLRVMIDQAVADNIGRRGSRTQQALGSFNNRQLVKR